MEPAQDELTSYSQATRYHRNASVKRTTMYNNHVTGHITTTQTCAFPVFTVTKALHTWRIDMLWCGTDGIISPETEGGIGTFGAIEADDASFHDSTLGSTATLGLTRWNRFRE